MAGWHIHSGTAVAFAAENIDTDQLIPARFMSTPRSEGYGGFLFFDQARDSEGDLRPDFPLAGAPDASVLITRRNFGCGSSREAAVYALLDAGFRAVVAPSFGDIFASNAINNGLLPATVSDASAERLLEVTGKSGAAVSIDIERNRLRVAGVEIDFHLDPVWKQKLINGWDDIDLTLADRTRIEAFSRTRKTKSPWMTLPR